MKVKELIQELQDCDPEQDVYYMGVGGDWEYLQKVEPDNSGDKLSIEPYDEDKKFVGLR